MKKINLIVCVDNKYGISKNGYIPWDINVEMTYFNNITTMTSNGLPTNQLKNAIIMGSNTWKSINKELPDRLNIIISNTLKLNDHNNIKIVDSYENAYNICNQRKDIDRIFIIGGAELYHYIFVYILGNGDLLENIYINKIDYNYNCDKFLNHKLLNYVIKDINPNQYTYNLYDKSLDHNVNIELYKYGECINNPHLYGEYQYIQLLDELIRNGEYRKTRNGATWSLFNKQLIFDMKDGFPLLTSKKIVFKHIIGELLWFLRGDTNTKILEKDNINIWKKNTSKEFIKDNNLQLNEGDIGPMYGFQLRHYGEKYNSCHDIYYGYDQIQYCLNLIKNDPSSRRIIMTTYNPQQATEGVLYPCHGIVTQFYVKNNRLSLSTYQRSADVFLGLPWNIASYSLLLHIFCELVNNDKNYSHNKLVPGEVIITLGDYHLYEEHYEKAIIQILRANERLYKFPQLKIHNKPTSINDIKIDDFELLNYISYKGLIADMKQ